MTDPRPSGSKPCTARRVSPAGPGTGSPSPASSGTGATSTEARFPIARHQRNHPFAAVPDYVSAAYAGVAIKPQ